MSSTAAAGEGGGGSGARGASGASGVGEASVSSLAAATTNVRAVSAPNSRRVRPVSRSLDAMQALLDEDGALRAHEPAVFHEQLETPSHDHPERKHEEETR